MIDSVGSWNGTAYGQFAYTSDRGGAILLSPGSVRTAFAPASAAPHVIGAGYINLGTRAFGGPMSWLFWANQVVPQPDSRVFDWAASDATNGLLFVPLAGQRRGCAVVVPANASFSNYARPDPVFAKCFGFAAAPSVWNHYAWTVDGNGTSSVYVNATLVYAGAGIVPPLATRSNTFVGRSNERANTAAVLEATQVVSDFQFALGSALTSADVQNMFHGLGCPPNTAATPPPPLALRVAASSPASPVDATVIGGAVGGAVAACAVLVAGCIYVCRRCRRHQHLMKAKAAAAPSQRAGAAPRVPRPKTVGWQAVFADASELEIGPVLGSGGFATVHAATWRGTDVAVKVWPPKAETTVASSPATPHSSGVASMSSADPDFAREVAFLGSLRHPNGAETGEATPTCALLTYCGLQCWRCMRWCSAHRRCSSVRGFATLVFNMTSSHVLLPPPSSGAGHRRQSRAVARPQRLGHAVVAAARHAGCRRCVLRRCQALLHDVRARPRLLSRRTQLLPAWPFCTHRTRASSTSI